MKRIYVFREKKAPFFAYRYFYHYFDDACKKNEYKYICGYSLHSFFTNSPSFQLDFETHGDPRTFTALNIFSDKAYRKQKVAVIFIVFMRMLPFDVIRMLVSEFLS